MANNVSVADSGCGLNQPAKMAPIADSPIDGPLGSTADRPARGVAQRRTNAASEGASVAAYALLVGCGRPCGGCRFGTTSPGFAIRFARRGNGA